MLICAVFCFMMDHPLPHSLFQQPGSVGASVLAALFSRQFEDTQITPHIYGSVQAHGHAKDVHSVSLTC